mgnify:CR=1 FL=1
MNLGQSIIEVQLHLMEPGEGTPSTRQILQKLKDTAQLLHLEMQNTAIAWDVSTFQIFTVSQQADYLIPADAATFGKDFRVVTINPNDPYHSSREIRRCDIGDNDNFYNGPVVSPSGGHSAVVCNFFRQAGGIYMKLVPTPSEAGKIYEVWYETAEPQMSLGSSPVLAPFERYLNIKAAITLVGLCRWGDLAGKELFDRQMALKAGLVEQAIEYKKAWENWIASDREDGTTTRISYGAGYGEGYYGYY